MGADWLDFRVHGLIDDVDASLFGGRFFEYRVSCGCSTSSLFNFLAGVV